MSDDEINNEAHEETDVYPYGEYIGERDENYNRHGFGTALLPNGDYYEGYYHRGLRNDVGFYCFQEGQRYEGEWRKGLKHGHGEFIYPDGSRYVGTWYKNLRQGYGTYYYQNRDTYDGAWYKNKRHGLGSYSFVPINVQVMGNWTDGILSGPIQIVYPSYSFYGTFKDNFPCGQGMYVFGTQFILLGFFIEVAEPKNNPAIEGSTFQFGHKIAPRVPIWISCKTVRYDVTLIPAPAIAAPVSYSTLSLISIVDYLQRGYGMDGYQGDEEDGMDAAYYYRQLADKVQSEKGQSWNAQSRKTQSEKGQAGYLDPDQPFPQTGNRPIICKCIPEL